MKIKNIIWIFLISILFFSCDNFILLEQFDRNGGLRINPQKTTLVQETGSVNLNIQGGTRPYTIELIESNLYNSVGADFGSITNEFYIPGIATGTVQVKVTDQNGFHVEEFFTIVPKAPTIVDWTGTGTSIDISWTAAYTASSYIDGFIVEVSHNGGSFTNLATILSSSTYTYNTTGIQNDSYAFRVAAVANGTPSQWITSISKTL